MKGPDLRISGAQLTLLLNAIRLGSVGKAARQAGMTQSGASQAIASLERMLGASLLARTRDGVAPTALALSILDDAAEAVAAIGRIAEKARHAAASRPRTLLVASIPSVANSLLPQWRRSFLSLHPETEVNVVEGNHDDVNHWVRQGVADIGLTSIEEGDLVALPLRREELFAIGPRDMPAFREPAVRLDVLATQSVILASGCGPVVDGLYDAGAAPGQRRIHTQTMPAALALVRQGLGLTIFAQSAFPRNDIDGLKVRPFDPPAYRDLFLVSRGDDAGCEMARTFAAVACQAPH